MKKKGIIAVVVFFIVIIGVWRYSARVRDAVPSWDVRSAEINQLDQEMKILAQKIKPLLGTSRCERHIECRIMGIGPIACGKYKDFLVYSTVDADEGVLLPLVTEFNTKATRILDLKLAPNTCGTKTPLARCNGGRCGSVNEP